MAEDPSGESHGRNRYPIAAGGGDGEVETGAVTQPGQPVERHNGRMGFAARLLWVIAAAAGLLGAQSGAPRFNPKPHPISKP